MAIPLPEEYSMSFLQGVPPQFYLGCNNFLQSFLKCRIWQQILMLKCTSCLYAIGKLFANNYNKYTNNLPISARNWWFVVSDQLFVALHCSWAGQNIPEGRRQSFRISRRISVCLNKCLCAWNTGAFVSQEIRLSWNRLLAIPKAILESSAVRGERGTAARWIPCQEEYHFGHRIWHMRNPCQKECHFGHRIVGDLILCLKRILCRHRMLQRKDWCQKRILCGHRAGRKCIPCQNRILCGHRMGLKSFWGAICRE